MNIIDVKNEKSEMDKRRIFISFTFVICLTIFVPEYFKLFYLVLNSFIGSDNLLSSMKNAI